MQGAENKIVSDNCHQQGIKNRANKSFQKRQN